MAVLTSQIASACDVTVLNIFSGCVPEQCCILHVWLYNDYIILTTIYLDQQWSDVSNRPKYMLQVRPMPDIEDHLFILFCWSEINMNSHFDDLRLYQLTGMWLHIQWIWVRGDGEIPNSIFCIQNSVGAGRKRYKKDPKFSPGKLLS